MDHPALGYIAAVGVVLAVVAVHAGEGEVLEVGHVENFGGDVV